MKTCGFLLIGKAQARICSCIDFTRPVCLNALGPLSFLLKIPTICGISLYIKMVKKVKSVPK